MKEHIEREAAVKAVEIVDFYKGSGIVPSGYASDAIRAIPAADVREVVKAHWIKSDLFGDMMVSVYTCSNCNRVIRVPSGLNPAKDIAPFCHCGAEMTEMRGEADGN